MNFDEVAEIVPTSLQVPGTGRRIVVELTGPPHCPFRLRVQDDSYLTSIVRMACGDDPLTPEMIRSVGCWLQNDCEGDVFDYPVPVSAMARICGEDWV